MTEIIFGYECPASFFRPKIELMFAFYVFDYGEVTIKKFSYEENIIKIKKIIIPSSVIETIKKYLIEQKNLIDKLPKEIPSFVICGDKHYFNFIGKEFYCWNPEKIIGERYEKLESCIGKLSPEGKEVVLQHNYIFEIFETIYTILKDYGLKVNSSEYLVCDWEM